MKRITEFSSMMLIRHRRIISVISVPKKSSKRSTRRCRFLIASKKFNSHNAEDDTRICCTWFVTESSVCHCIYNRNWRWVTLSVFLWRLGKTRDMLVVPLQSTASRPLQCGFSGERHYLHELRKQIKIRKLYVVMILKKLNWLFFDLTQLERVHTKASSKIMGLGRSVSQRRMPRETEKLPLTMIGGKPTDGTSTNKKNQDAHGMMKSENL